jgi:DNA-binding CsgD family transcriptional regulator
MGFFLAWIVGSRFSDNLFIGAPSNNLLGLASLFDNGANIVALLLCAAFARRLTPLLRNASGVYLVGVCIALGTALGTFAPASGKAQPILSVVGAALHGAGFGFMFLQWNDVYSRVPMRLVSIAYAGSYLISALLFFLCLALDPLIAALIECSLPLVSAFLLLQNNSLLAKAEAEAAEAEETEGEAAQAADSPATHWRFPLQPAVLMGLYAFAYHFFLHLSRPSSVSDQMGVVLIAGIVVVMCLFFFDRFDLRILFKIALPCMTGGLLLHILKIDAAATLIGVLTNLSFTGFTLFTMIILCNICYRYGVVALWLIGIIRLISKVFHLLGSYSANWLSGTYADQAFVADAALALVVVVLVTVCMFSLNERDFAATWGITPLAARTKEGAEESGAVTLAAVMGPHEEFAWRLARVARHFGLTHREEDVLALLAQNQSVAQIEKTLFISHGTAKGHIRHIYAKLDIHSRDEAIETVRSMYGPSSAGTSA